MAPEPKPAVTGPRHLGTDTLENDLMYRELRQLSPETVEHMRSHQDRILEDWLNEQLTAESLRLDLMDQRALEDESKALLRALTTALSAGDGRDFTAANWQPVKALLEEISEVRDKVGFSPNETATFVLSLRHPLIDCLLPTRKSVSMDAEIWLLIDILDQMALHTTQVYQRRREATIHRQQEEMEELSTPVVKIWDGILALPLVGTLDTRRSQMVTEALLEAVARTGSEIAIIDLTGVPAIDTRMAQHLMRTVAASRLMGADCILSGIRPQIAQTIVHLKINLGDIKTESTLAAALKSALSASGLEVMAKS